MDKRQLSPTRPTPGQSVLGVGCPTTWAWFTVCPPPAPGRGPPPLRPPRPRPAFRRPRTRSARGPAPPPPPPRPRARPPPASPGRAHGRHFGGLEHAQHVVRDLSLVGRPADA